MNYSGNLNKTQLLLELSRFYVFDRGNMNEAVIKPTVQNWSYSGVMQYYYQFMQVVEKHEMKK